MTHLPLPTTREAAAALDQHDPLGSVRSRFAIPEGMTYLVGHSLGPLTHSAAGALRQAYETDWQNDIVGAWNAADWINLPQTVGAKIAPLIGAGTDDVVICDSVSVNLFKLTASVLRTLSGTATVIVEEDEFPTDQYITEALANMAGAEFIRAAADEGASHLSAGAVLVKSLVNYRTAQIVDAEALEAEAGAKGAAIIWDLSHATGIVPVDVKKAGISYATGCTYKYLNGGPGAPSFVYVAPDKVRALNTPLPGWLGHEAPFAFEKTYRPADGTARFVAGTPPILSLAALSGALDVFGQVALPGMFAKTRLLGDIILARAGQMGLATASPGDPAKRGGHVSLIHEDGYPIVQALATRGIKADFRTPDTIRFGLSPLYLGYAQVWDVMDTLADIIETHSWDRPEFKARAKVT